MNKPLKDLIEQHLKHLELKPKYTELSASDGLWRFELAPNLEAELFYHNKDANPISLVMLSSMDTDLEEQTQSTFVHAMSQVCTPVSLLSSERSISLRLHLQATQHTLSQLLSEGVILCRFFAGPLFLGLSELQSNQSSLDQTIKETLSRLKDREIHS